MSDISFDVHPGITGLPGPTHGRGGDPRRPRRRRHVRVGLLFLGLVSSHAVGIGLLYSVIWEGLFSGFVSGVRLLSIRHYVIALMHAIDPRRFAGADTLHRTWGWRRWCW